METEKHTRDSSRNSSSMEERRAALSLACFMAEYGWPLRVPTQKMTMKELWGCPDALLAGLLKLPRKALPRLMEFRKRFSATAMLDQFERDGTGLVTLGEPDYPSCLAQIHDPPPALFMKGATPLPEIMGQPRVAIVGARAASRYGIDAASGIARGLARFSVSVVSGMALGIDAAAHTGSLERRGRNPGSDPSSDPGHSAIRNYGHSLAVLGCGPDVVYPPSNRALYASLLHHGLVISEYPPGTQPMPWRFPARNRIMAGLSDAVIVVEARAKSGSLITADFALDEGREVFAVPGSIFSKLSSGPHALIRNGAAAVTSAEDVLESLGLELEQQSLSLLDTDPAAAPPGLSDEEHRLFLALEALPAHPDILASRARLSTATSAAALISLELKSLASLEPGRGYRLP
ncbi:MAG: DNA-processing protein DprA [Thermoleophilia bacterium]|nr:DNA-processing protein DprA [Thermoleophilia bacterium]